jgi:hypothetical protein
MDTPRHASQPAACSSVCVGPMVVESYGSILVTAVPDADFTCHPHGEWASVEGVPEQVALAFDVRRARRKPSSPARRGRPLTASVCRLRPSSTTWQTRDRRWGRRRRHQARAASGRGSIRAEAWPIPTDRDLPASPLSPATTRRRCGSRRPCRPGRTIARSAAHRGSGRCSRRGSRPPGRPGARRCSSARTRGRRRRTHRARVW